MLAAALLGIFLIGDRTGLRLETGVAAAILVAVVAWGAFRAYQGVWLAPRGHYVELTRSTKSSAARGRRSAPRSRASGRGTSSATWTPKARAIAAAGRSCSSTAARRKTANTSTSTGSGPTSSTPTTCS